jgi:uncharacterized membrane protein (DUF485 family)
VDYLHESGVSIHRRRQRRRAAITLSIVALLMLGTFAYAAAYFQGWVGNRTPEPVASRACQVVTAAVSLKPSTVTINVYNATNRNGLAASVAKLLRTQGFKIADVANDPMDKRIEGVGEVRHGRSGAAAATLAAARLAGVKVVLDARTDNTVDLVLGNRFTALRSPPKVTPSKATKPSPSATVSC